MAAIFPESDLPRPYQIPLAAEPYYEGERLENHRHHYARTCMAWFENLTAKSAEAFELVGEQRATHFLKFLRAAAKGFDTGVFVLLRVTLRRLDEPVRVSDVHALKL